MKHEGSLQCSQEPATCPYPESHPLQKIILGPRLSIPLRENDKLLRSGIVSSSSNTQAERCYTCSLTVMTTCSVG